MHGPQKINKRVFFLLFLVLSLLLLSGCGQTKNVKVVETLIAGQAAGPVKIVLMPVDVELSILTASGLVEPQAEWTSNAVDFLHQAFGAKVSEHGYQLVPYEAQTTSPESDLVQLEKLHETVGFSVLYYSMGPRSLPTKVDQFDWSLGEKCQLLKAQTGADYALFSYVRDSYSSGGRIVMQVGLAILGIGVPGGIQVGFASLVDLNTGKIVWFNRMVDGTGDMREQDTANVSVALLMDNFPLPNMPASTEESSNSISLP